MRPGALTFEASSDSERVELGGAIAAGDPVTVRAAVPSGLDATIVLLRDGRESFNGRGGGRGASGGAGAYRVEVRLAGRRVPWIVSNAIRVGGGVAPAPPPGPAGIPARRQAAPDIPRPSPPTPG